MEREHNRKGFLQDCRGFSLLEVLLGISVFMIGMLGVTALNISSLKSNTFSGNLSEATLLAARQIEEIMAMEFDLIADGDGDGTGQDQNDNGTDDDDPGDAAADIDNKENFGLDDIKADADNDDNEGIGKNEIYSVYWNVAVDEPISTGLETSKTVKVIVYWEVKGEPRQISMSVTRTSGF